jgi:hypothetical protein
MQYELMGHKMNTANQFCEECGESKGRIVAMGLACNPKVETENREEPEERIELENEN